MLYQTETTDRGCWIAESTPDVALPGAATQFSSRRYSTHILSHNATRLFKSTPFGEKTVLGAQILRHPTCL
jgi:hypothetical protein